MSEQAEPVVITLGNLADGAAEELFGEAFAKVLENIGDPNTDHKAARKIALTFTIMADEDRNAGEVQIACATKLAGVKKKASRIFIGRHHGKLEAVEALPQLEFTAPVGKPQAVPPQQEAAT